MQHFVGQVIDFRGSRFHCVEMRDYTRLDGKPSGIAVIVSACVKCGEVFEFMRSKNYQKFSPNRRCEAHKSPRHKVKKVWHTLD